MPFARVVSFEGVEQARIDQLKGRVEGEERPEGVPATEMLLLHDENAATALAILFFETEDDYRRGDETLSAMPDTETPGTRTSVSKYKVAFRVTA
jgi:hypothetical protein